MMARHPVAAVGGHLALQAGALVVRPQISTIVITTAAQIPVVLVGGLVERARERERRKTLLAVLAQQKDAPWPTRVVQTEEGFEITPIDTEPTTKRLPA